MAVYNLENAQIGICVDSFGAELKSLKKLASNVEYMWMQILYIGSGLLQCYFQLLGV